MAAIFIELYFFIHYVKWENTEKLIVTYIGVPTPFIFKIFLQFICPLIAGTLLLLGVYVQCS